MNFKRFLSSDSKEPFIIAETAFSHEGSKSYLKEMIHQLKGTSNIGIKFQVLIEKKEFLTPSNESYEVIDKWLLKKAEWRDLIDYAFLEGVPVIIAVLDTQALDLVKSLKDKISAIEIHPSCIPDMRFMNNVSEFCRIEEMPLFIGVSGFDFDEIDYMFHNYLQIFDRQNLLLMYGFQNYPTNLESLHLNRIKLFEEKFQVKVGYADHTEFNNRMKNLIVSSVYGLGVNIIEIHYVLEYGVNRIDYITAYDSNRLIELHEQLLLIKKANGIKTEEMSNSEKEYSFKFRKIPVYNKNLDMGHKIEFSDIAFKRSNEHSKFKITEIKRIIGKTINKNVIENQSISTTELE